MPIAGTPEQRALQDALRDWAKRNDAIALVRAREAAPPEPDTGGLTHILSPDDVSGSVAAAAAAAEQLAASLIPGGLMPALLAAVLTARTFPQAAVALDPGTLTAGPDGRVSGRTAPVLGATDGTTLIAGTVADQWFAAEPGSPGLTVTPLAPLDFSRDLAIIEHNDVTVTPLPGLNSRRVRDVAATLFAAEAAGVAAWCAATATQHAKTRRQFGRAIGEFQAVKHLCATMHCRAERAAAVAWDAARAADLLALEAHGTAAERSAREQYQVAAATAAAIAIDDAVDNAKDCVQVLGGIGFTWEHDAHLYLRRAMALRQLLGGTAGWRDRLAELTGSGVRRVIHSDVRSDGRSDVPSAAGQAEPDAGANVTAAIGIGAWAIPAIRGYGTAAQQDRFIPATLTGGITWCQLFSEPEAGSDLAGLKTRAVRDEEAGGWRLTGQKVWTSLAREADWAICLARTDPVTAEPQGGAGVSSPPGQARPKHKGITYFLVDMHADGIEIRPLREITGRSVFNEVFLDNVLVPDDCVIGAPGDGWRVAMTTLATERERLGAGQGEQSDPVVALLDLRGAHPAVRKLIGVERRQAAAEAALTGLGPAGAVNDTAEAHEFLLTRCLSIAGGTTQILLNQVAERVLGLPRER